MPDPPLVSGDQAVSALRRLGYEVVRTRGSHVRMRAADRPPVTVPLHREIDRTTLRSIIRTVGISIEEFIELVRG